MLNEPASKEYPIELVNLSDKIGDLTDIVRDHLHQGAYHIGWLVLGAHIPIGSRNFTKANKCQQ